MIARPTLAAVRASILLGCATLTIAADTTSGGIDLTGIDHAVRPGDDFDAYSNGSWRASAQISADRTSAGNFLDMSRSFRVVVSSPAIGPCRGAPPASRAC